MTYLYYKSEKGNFGDDLNPWLWNQIFGEANDIDHTAFLGVGSILFNDFPLIKSLVKDQRKIVFGTGIRPSHIKFKIDDTWDIRFLRGPLSSASFNNEHKFIADAAYAMRLLPDFEKFMNVSKEYEIGLMPYFKSIEYFDWKKICDILGFRFISPYSEKGVEYTINEIASCKVFVTEAMHGAIVADILRVPWNRYILTTPFTEGPMVSEFKWMDWLYSINKGNTDATFINFYKDSSINRYVRKLTSNMINVELFVKNNVQSDIINSLKAIKNFYLSDDSVINEIDNKIKAEIVDLRSRMKLNKKI